MVHDLLRRDKFWQYCLVFVIAFFVYLYTTPNAITLEDDGLFIMSGYFAGISHPPGYPLYSLLGKMFSLLPVGTVPFRLHLLSAFFGAATCVMIALTTRTLVSSTVLAIISGLAFAFTRQFWAQSIISEVYTLNAFLLFTILYLLIILNVRKDVSRQAYIPSLAVFLLGLSLTLHWPLILLSSPALIILAWPVRDLFLSKPLKKAGLFLLSLTPYVWMVWRSNTDVLISFYGPIQSLADFWYMFTRQGFVSVDISTTVGLEDKIAFVRFMLDELIIQFSLAGTCLVITGFVMQWKRWQLPICISLLLVFLGHTVSFQLLLYFDYDDLNKAVFSVYPLVAYGVMAIWLVLGVNTVAELITRFIIKDSPRWIYSSIIGILIIGTLLIQNFGINNRREYSFAKDYAEIVLDNLPENAELFVDGDIPTFTIGYKHYVEKIRPDISLYNIGGIVYSNRLFNPVNTDENSRLKLLEEHVSESNKPVCTTGGLSDTVSRIDSWIFNCIDNSGQINSYSISLNENIYAYYQKLLLDNKQSEAWTIHFRQQLLKKTGAMMGRSFVRKIPLNEYVFWRDFDVTDNFFISLGYLQGIASAPATTSLLNEMIRVLAQGITVPQGAKKEDRGSFFALRGVVSEKANSLDNAIMEYQTSIDIWPHSDNASIPNLLGIYTQNQNREAYNNLKDEVSHLPELRETIRQYNLLWDRRALQ